MLRERVAWGRLFGSLRVRGASTGRRLGLVLASPLVPGVLFLRLLRDRLMRRVSLSQLARAVPVTVALLAALVLGEVIGVVSGDS